MLWKMPNGCCLDFAVMGLRPFIGKISSNYRKGGQMSPLVDSTSCKNSGDGGKASVIECLTCVCKFTYIGY